MNDIKYKSPTCLHSQRMNALVKAGVWNTHELMGKLRDTTKHNLRKHKKDQTEPRIMTKRVHKYERLAALFD